MQAVNNNPVTEAGLLVQTKVNETESSLHRPRKHDRHPGRTRSNVCTSSKSWVLEVLGWAREERREGRARVWRRNWAGWHSGAAMGPQDTDAPVKVSWAQVDTKL